MNRGFVHSLRGCRLLAAICISSIIGCSGTSIPMRFPISGNATFNGQPIPTGTVSFEPNDPTGNQTAHCSGKITHGKYSIAGDVGHIGGPYIVYVNGFDGDAESTGGESELGRGLFPTYSAKKTLPQAAAIWDLDIPQPKSVGRSP